MVREEQARIAQQVADRWIRRRQYPSVPLFHLPAGLVSALELGDRLLAMDRCTVFTVTAVGPGALVLAGSETTQAVFDNHGYADYAWAYYAAPHLHWLLNR